MKKSEQLAAAAAALRALAAALEAPVEPPQPVETRLLTYEQAAEQLQLDVSSVCRMARRGVLPLVKLGAHAARVRARDVEDLIRRRTQLPRRVLAEAKRARTA